MTISTPRSLLLCTIAASIAACGGDSPSAVLPPPPPPLGDVQEGNFKGTNVSGLRFVSGAESGLTDPLGRYRCETGNTVTFFVGSVELGTMQCSTLASAPALAGSGALDDPAAMNLASFLLVLDGDENPDNGITISEDLQTMAASWPAIDFAAVDFGAELAVPLSDIMSVEQRMPFALWTTPDLVRQVVEESLSCAYSGAFIGGTAGEAIAPVALTVTRDTLIRDADSVVWTIWDVEDGITRGTYGRLELAVRPRFDTTAVNDSIPVDGIYGSPDAIDGSWRLAGTAANLAGTYAANRIGGDPAAQTRMSGEFYTDDGGLGVLALDITGNAITGVAFEGFEGVVYTITGTLEGDDVTLTAVGGGETIRGTGEVWARDRFGLVKGLSGDIGIGGTFFANGCRLN
jgi:hypothetical protein